MEQTLNLPGQVPSSTLNRIHETSAKFQRYKILLRRRWWFLLLTASIGVCVGAMTITGKPTEYRSLAKLVAGGRMVADGNISWEEQRQDFYGTIIETVESAEMKRRALDRVRALHPDIKDAEVDIRVAQTRGSAIFNVFAIGSERAYTKIFLDALLDEFVAFRSQIREQALGRTLTSFAENVVTREKQLQERADKLAAFRRANNIVNLTNGNNEAAAFLTSLKAERERRLTEFNDIKLAMGDVDTLMQNRERNATTAQSGSIPPGPSAQQNPERATPNVDTARMGNVGLTTAERDFLDTKKELLRLNSDRNTLLKSFKAQHPMVVELDEKIENAQALLKSFEDEIHKQLLSQQADLSKQIQNLDQRIAEKQKEAIELGSKLATHEQLEEDFKASKLAYDRMFERVQEFQQLSNIQTDYVAIQERASAAIEDQPDLKMPIILGLAVGLGAGIVILLLFDRLDDRMNSYSEFQALFPGESVLGQIPEQHQRGDVPLLRPSDDRHLYAEAFRNVRSSILFKNWGGKPPKTILVTSAVPNEGKTTVTSNLAVTMALSGSRVLLADCDLRRGGVNELFKLPASPGLSEALRGKLHWRDAVQETGTRNLDLLARGEVFDQTSEMLLSKTAEEMLREMGDEYDYVIFDSAPVLVADDTASFAPKLDTVLFIVRMSSTMARLSGKALDLLYERQVNIGGVILNRSSSNLKEYTYYNYASYYYAPVKTAQKEAAATPTQPTNTLANKS